jgi:hypothetical protein
MIFQDFDVMFFIFVIHSIHLSVRAHGDSKLIFMF